MVNRVLNLGDRTVESMMTPRTRIVWLDTTANFAENLAEMRATPYSRYPVYRGSDAARELGMNVSQTVDALLAEEVRRRAEALHAV